MYEKIKKHNPLESKVGKLRQQSDVENVESPGFKYAETPEYEPFFVPEKKIYPHQLSNRIKNSLRAYYERYNPEALYYLQKNEFEKTPEVIAISLLEFLSGRPGKIRRSGKTYRNPDYDADMIHRMVGFIRNNQPISLFGLSFSPKFRNSEISGGKLLPDMANYLAFLNLQQIARGAEMIYPPGLEINVGYEGNLYRALGRYRQETQDTLEILKELNERAYTQSGRSEEEISVKENPVKIIDAAELVQQCLVNVEGQDKNEWQNILRDRKDAVQQQYEFAVTGINEYISSHRSEFSKFGLQGAKSDKSPIDVLRENGKLFEVLIKLMQDKQRERKSLKTEDRVQNYQIKELDEFIQLIDTLGGLESWMSFYRSTLSFDMFKTERTKEGYIKRMAFYYRAFNEIKYTGGKYGYGILDFNPTCVPITVNGSSKKMNLQLVPGWDYFPHHRLTARVLKIDKKGDKRYEWVPVTHEQIRHSDSIYIPRYVQGYDYPFYYEQLQSLAEGSFNERTSMGASVHVMESEQGEKFIVKRGIYKEPYEHLLRQVRRTRQMREAGVSIIPELIDSNVKDNEVYYVMPFIKGGTLDEQYFGENAGRELSRDEFVRLLSDLQREMWSKGEIHTEERYFSNHHLCSVERGLELLQNIDDEHLRGFSQHELVKINGKMCVNMGTLLRWIRKSISILDRDFSDSVIPQFTHGDLHFGNILIDQKNKLQLIDINGSPERDTSSIEFELSRILLSFYRQIIRDKEYLVTVDEFGNATVEYTKRGKQLLEQRELFLQSMISNSQLMEFSLSDVESSDENMRRFVSKIKLLEAIDIATVFGKRPEDEQAATYLIGTELLHTALQNHESGVVDIAVFEHMKDQVTVDNYRDPQVYTNIERLYRAIPFERWTEYSISHLFNQFVISATRENGKTTSVLIGLPEFADDIAGRATGILHESGYPVITKDFQDLLEVWQRLNFPENRREKLFRGFVTQERAIWNSIFEQQGGFMIDGKNYRFTRMLGLGKESKVFEAIDESSGKKVAIKIGLQYLDEEYQYTKVLQERAGDLAKRFPQCYGYDHERNMLIMELIDGKQAEDIVAELKEPKEWTSFLREISEVVEHISCLHEKGVVAGQFNLRNVMVEQDGTYRIIDPLYEGDRKVYEAKQMMRVLGVLIQKIYKTNPGIFPLQVKSANSPGELRTLPYPEKELNAIQSRDVGIPEYIHSEFVRICKKYLSQGLKNRTLHELASDFSGMRELCESYELREQQEEERFFTEKPRAVMLDLNGTLEDGGFINARTVASLKRLNERGVPVVIVSGKRYDAIAGILNANGIDPSRFQISADVGAAYYRNGKLVQDFFIEKVDTKTKQVQLLLFKANICADIRNNKRRINIAFYDLNEEGMKIPRAGYEDEVSQIKQLAESFGLDVIATNNGEQLDLVLSGVNKATALVFLEQTYGIKDSSVVKIGNEPNENDHKLLFDEKGRLKTNAYVIERVAQTTLLIRRVMNEVGYGAMFESGELATAFGSINDYSKTIRAERVRLDRLAKENSNVFYPYFALKERIKKQDNKKVDYKWVIRDTKGTAIGLSALYELPNVPGFYNIGGMFLTPEAQGKGVATETMNKIFEFARDKVPGFKGICLRVAELNLPSRRLVEKTGFIPTQVREGDYTLFVEGQEVKTHTIVYERTVDGNVKGIDLVNDPRLKSEEVIKSMYEKYSQKKSF
jgi:hydroxymethylpyrimidine pyrophosphatase-like HAD family hydrolase/RIO-like serine/threonine protein kinase/RimJ/RimL family protein N-acetyltransferase